MAERTQIHRTYDDFSNDGDFFPVHVFQCLEWQSGSDIDFIDPFRDCQPDIHVDLTRQ